MVRYSTPGNILPSNNSNDAPPPVETWLNLSLALFAPTRFTVSPPPTMVVAPLDVYLTNAFNILTEPFLNYSISNAPYGPFHTTNFIIFKKYLFLLLQ